MSDVPDMPARPSAFPPRKRVVAREVSAEVEAANRRDALVTPADLLAPDAVIDAADSGGAPPMPAEAFAEQVTVVDPTTLGGRRRRTSHHRLYRWTQACTLLCAGAAAAAVICTGVDEVAAAQACACPAIAVGLVATVLSGRSSLSARWRGWAIAALVFAGAALALTWIQPAVTAEPSVAPRARQAGGT